MDAGIQRTALLVSHLVHAHDVNYQNSVQRSHFTQNGAGVTTNLSNSYLTSLTLDRILNVRIRPEVWPNGLINMFGNQVSNESRSVPASLVVEPACTMLLSKKMVNQKDSTNYVAYMGAGAEAGGIFMILHGQYATGYNIIDYDNATYNVKDITLGKIPLNFAFRQLYDFKHLTSDIDVKQADVMGQHATGYWKEVNRLLKERRMGKWYGYVLGAGLGIIAALRQVYDKIGFFYSEYRPFCIIFRNFYGKTTEIGNILRQYPHLPTQEGGFNNAFNRPSGDMNDALIINPAAFNVKTLTTANIIIIDCASGDYRIMPISWSGRSSSMLDKLSEGIQIDKPTEFGMIASFSTSGGVVKAISKYEQSDRNYLATRQKGTYKDKNGNIVEYDLPWMYSIPKLNYAPNSVLSNHVTQMVRAGWAWMVWNGANDQSMVNGATVTVKGAIHSFTDNILYHVKPHLTSEVAAAVDRMPLNKSKAWGTYKGDCALIIRGLSQIYNKMNCMTELDHLFSGGIY